MQRHRETLEEEAIHVTDEALMALAIGLVVTPAAYHRQVERGRVSRRFVDLFSALLTFAMLPLVAGVCVDTYLIARLILTERGSALIVAAGTALLLAGLWYGLPAFCRRFKS